MNIALTLIIYSPYLAFLPFLYLTYRYIKKDGIYIPTSLWGISLLFLFFWSIWVNLINHQGLYSLSSLVILGYFILYTYIQTHFKHIQAIEKLFSSFFLFSLGSAFIGIGEKLNWITYTPALWKYILGIRSIVDIGEIHRIAGTFNNPNLAGTWYASMIMIGFYFFQKEKGVRKVGYLIGTFLYVLVLAYTESRGAIIGLFIGFVAYTYFSGHKKKMLFLASTLLSGVALMLYQPQWFPRGDILFSSIRDRQEIWEGCFQMFLLKPLTGWGIFGIYLADSSVYHYLRVFHAHNMALTIATTLGFVGLFTWLMMEWDMLQKVRKLFYRKAPFVPLLIGIHTLILGHGLFDFTIMNPQIGILFVGTSALIGKLSTLYRVSPSYFPLYVKKMPTKKYKKA